MVLIICPSPEPSYSMQKFGRWLILKYLFKVIGCLRPNITELQIFNLLYKELKFWDLRGIMGLLLLCVSPCLPVYNNHSYKDVLCTFFFKIVNIRCLRPYALGRTGISISVLRPKEPISEQQLMHLRLTITFIWFMNYSVAIKYPWISIRVQSAPL